MEVLGEKTLKGSPSGRNNEISLTIDYAQVQRINGLRIEGYRRRGRPLKASIDLIRMDMINCGAMENMIFVRVEWKLVTKIGEC